MKELEEERERSRQVVAAERKAMEAEYKSTRDVEARTTAALRQDTERSLAEQARRHEVDVRTLREQLAIEKESWEDMFRRKMDVEIKSKVSL